MEEVVDSKIDLELRKKIQEDDEESCESEQPIKAKQIKTLPVECGDQVEQNLISEVISSKPSQPVVQVSQQIPT